VIRKRSADHAPARPLVTCTNEADPYRRSNGILHSDTRHAHVRLRRKPIPLRCRLPDMSKTDARAIWRSSCETGAVPFSRLERGAR
jgi:hypothetical protein